MFINQIKFSILLLRSHQVISSSSFSIFNQVHFLSGDPEKKVVMGEIDTKSIESVHAALPLFGEKSCDHKKKYRSTSCINVSQLAKLASRNLLMFTNFCAYYNDVDEIS